MEALKQKQGLIKTEEQSITDVVKCAAFYSLMLNDVISNLVAMLPEEQTDAAETIEMILRNIYEER